MREHTREPDICIFILNLERRGTTAWFWYDFAHATVFQHILNMCIYSMSSAIQAASCYQLQGLPDTCETCPIISTCMPTKKLHFQELKSPKSLTQHGFQKCISKCIPTCVKSFQPYMLYHRTILQHAPLLLSLNRRKQPTMACQLCSTVRHFISEQYSKLHSMRKCRLSHL